MIGFCCATPYHLLLTLHMATHEFANEKKCLIVFNHFSNTEEVVERINCSKIFEEVILIKNQKLGRLTKWVRRMHLLVLYSSIKKLCHKYTFDKIIFFLLDPLIIAPIIKKIIEKNPVCEVCLGEDGIGAYITPHLYKPKDANFKANLFLKLTGGEYWLNYFKYHYLLHPELVAYNSSLIIRKILPLKSDDENFNNLITKVWDTKTFEDYKILFLQQPLNESGLNSLEKIQIEFLKLFSHDGATQNLAIKVHPRSCACDYPQNCVIIGPEVMYEFAIKNMKETKLIVSVISSALLTPFLLWNKTIPIAFLYKMCKNSENELSENMEKFIYLFKQHFVQCGGKIYLPESKRELVSLLKSFGIGGLEKLNE